MSTKGLHSLCCAMLLFGAAPLARAESADYLTFARGAIPVTMSENALKAGIEQAMAAIDGDPRTFSATPKPGGADAEIWFVYRLPAATTFTQFFVPGIGETPSPSQTFFKEIEILGSDQDADGPFERLASTTLATHVKKDERTRIAAQSEKAVRWVKVRLQGGIHVERDLTFFEFSEIVGEGRREPVPMSDAFDGKWKGRGVRLELHQDGPRVSGCYDGEADLEGTVTGNLLHATGTHRTSGVPSAFVLTVGDDGGVVGVRSTNGAPFRMYEGAAAPDAATECANPVKAPGCGDILHGIQFDFDSDVIRPESKAVLDALHAGLKDAPESAITIVGHTSSEGAEDYNRDLSQRRAAAVVAALVELGIDAARLSAQGAGEARPIADNATETGRSLNRRVEIECR